MLRLLLCIYLLPLVTAAQSPEIRYATPQIYILKRTIAPLVPDNSGGPVPAVIHNEVSTFAGSGAPGGLDGKGVAATFQNPASIATDDDGNLYVADSFKSSIRKITPEGDVTTIAGGGTGTFANGNGKKAFFSAPFGVTRDRAGNLFVADANNSQIRKINLSADVTTFAGSFATGKKDGLGAAATFYHIVGIAIDPSGNLYIADSGNSLVRKIANDGNVTTFAGNGTKGKVNGSRLNASFNVPVCVATDDTGNIYISDFYNHLIRKITPDGMVSTLAGSGTAGFNDGKGSAPSFKNPWGLAADRAGNVYVADYGNNLIRRVAANGRVTTIAGNRTFGSADGPLLSASFNNPMGIAVDRFENIYVADFLNHKIRRITLGGYTIDRALPSGLVFDPKTGIISGTPQEIWPATVYTVTGYNVFGNSTATVTIEVGASVKASTKIPNAFSPNGDGINDSWVIRGLFNDPECKVLVFNRSGTVVFESGRGYDVAWNGEYNNQTLPVGVYYYVLSFSDGQKSSGSVMIMK
jgi:gliding motility-associated-like protein